MFWEGVGATTLTCSVRNISKKTFKVFSTFSISQCSNISYDWQWIILLQLRVCNKKEVILKWLNYCNFLFTWKFHPRNEEALGVKLISLINWSMRPQNWNSILTDNLVVHLNVTFKNRVHVLPMKLYRLIKYLVSERKQQSNKNSYSAKKFPKYNILI